MLKNYFKDKGTRAISLVLSLLLISAVLVYATGNGKYFLSSRASTGSVAVSIEPADIKTAPNTTGTFNIYVIPGTEKISSAELYINYDPQEIQITNVVAGSFFTSKSSIVGTPQELLKNYSIPGKITYALGFPMGSKIPGTTEPFYSSEAGALATVSYAVLPSAGGQSSITLSDTSTEQSIIGNIYAQNVLGQVNNATVLVELPTTITPTQDPIISAKQPTPTLTPTLFPTSINTRFPSLTNTPTATKIPTATPTQIVVSISVPSPSTTVKTPSPTISKRPKRYPRVQKFWEDASKYFRHFFRWEDKD